MNMKELAKAEKQVMQILWQLKEGVAKDIIEKMPDPKPAYNTVSTVVRVLEGKGFIDHKAYGNRLGNLLYNPILFLVEKYCECGGTYCFNFLIVSLLQLH
ncbi:BlaI/MecI/CopY family transcriptional regulator [Mucilaginibacter sp. L3T2-6]|uniref:BlaI/MecI/CopY family transcriptional regulator n=1 Tax=Mucilaginibacter sp. L3T2-6 TaxID=3062491 RepID=UPI0026757C7F|nr:BlaI/MecI/CopY family transcriptional regulator [Mucilaginibacter sp. L3T2-6]MDO3642743.1 BlaI/MecI/CopY family transcriptional regulator [Mucilaginibacter sp. L3T2-6]MDV6215392.1 BlaI/MecI/CopY family transcriptional regulator [Mucilaginibacter sp. L3T2-6]